MTIQEHKEEILKLEKRFPSKTFIQDALDRVLDRIKFLESIYITGAKWNVFSEAMNDCAVKERDELCRQSSACYSILEERGIKTI